MQSRLIKRLVEYEEQLLSVETRMRFIRQLTPLNFELELRRFEPEHQRALEKPSGLKFYPAFRYAPLIDVNQLRAELLEVHRQLNSTGSGLRKGSEIESLLERFILEELLLRNEELRLQLDVLEVRGDVKKSNRRAALLFSFSGPLLAESAALAKAWLGLGESSTEEGAKVELRSELRKIAAAEGEVLIIEYSDIASVAAVGAGKVLVKPNTWVSEGQARRIYAHEVHGHLLLRERSKGQLPPFQIGSAESECDEEGRAIWLEEASGFLDVTRKKELATRFLGAQALREQPSMSSIYECLMKHGVTSCSARDILRLFRGGALGREGVYLPSYLRVKSAFAAEQQLDVLMSRGRLSCATAKRLLSLRKA